VTRPDAAIYTQATLERGRQLAAAGDCIACHTGPGGTPNAGGLALETPFGRVLSTNLTPDPETGIGSWTISAFQRAMREGVSRDGRHLYPVFPYTAFAKTSDDDLMALYAYLMAQPAVRNVVPETRLAFPFNLRPLLALWNALYHDPTPYAPVAARSAEWNRGAYLVNGLGHCGACHTPRNALGAEQAGEAYLAGAIVEGWEAPALTTRSHSPVPWSAEELYRYLRSGHSLHHGSTAGPMAPVVQSLAAVPDADIRAMATYLASFYGGPGEWEVAEAADAALSRARAAGDAMLPSAAQRLFTGACGACHHDGNGPVELGLNLPLALHSSLHSERPDNLLRVVLEGIQAPASAEIGFMPAFRDALNDRQLAELAGYMRARYAPDKPAWEGLEEAAVRLRAARR
jgi:nicotinate dehydrogenase subunit B